MGDLEKSATGGDNGDKPREPGVTVSIPPEKRGRGRPPGSANKPKTESSPRPREDTPTIDPSLIGELFVSIAKIGDDMACLAILSKARTKLPKEMFISFQQEVNRLKFGVNDERMVREGGIALAKKYTFLLTWGPEVIILACFVQYCMRMGNCYRKISNLPDLPPEPKVAPPSRVEAASG